MTSLRGRHWIGLAALALGSLAACNCDPETPTGADAGTDAGQVVGDAGGDGSSGNVDSSAADSGAVDAAGIDSAAASDAAAGNDAAASTDATSAVDSAAGGDSAVANQPPQVTILSPPASRSFARGETIFFECYAVDPETGAIADADIVWTDGNTRLGIGANVQNALDAVGDHVVTCSATDPGGQSASASVTITIVANQAPQVTIQAPDDGSYFLASDAIVFAGAAIDPEDGVLSGSAVRWLDGSSQIGLGSDVTTALPLGDHVITLQATDSAGALGSATITIHVVDNLPPRCRIQQPGNGDTIVEGSSVTFDAQCVDPDGTTIANSAYLWTSSLDGQIGRGASVVNLLVGIGLHTITVCATDTTSGVLQGCAAVDITVVFNEPPVASISQPDAGAQFEACQGIALACRSSDPEGGFVHYQWSSNFDGDLGNSRDLFWQPQVSGSHVLTCTAFDAQGKSDSAQVTVAVLSPRVRIAQPADGSVHAPGSQITFTGNACDTVDGQLTGASLTWSSSVDGPLGTGAFLQTAALTAGLHIITLTATNAFNDSRSAAITLYVDTAPQVSITAPDNNASFATSANVHFTGSATDAEDGDLTAAIAWYDSASGAFDSGGAASASNLALGKHVVTAAATDSLGVTGQARVSILISDGSPLFASRNFGQTNAALRDPSSGEYWLAGNNGLRRVDLSQPGQGTLYTTDNSDLPGNTVHDVLVRSDGALLVATGNGLAACAAPGAGQTGSPSNCNTYQGGDLALQSDNVRTLLELPDGRTVVGTSQCLMLSSWTSDQHQDFCQGDGSGDGLIADRVQALAYDASRGAIWIGTDNGVSLLVAAAAPEVMDRDAFSFTDVTEADGLVDNDVRAIAVAPSGDLWFATAGGVSRLAAGAGGLFTSYTAADGLPSNTARGVAIDVVTIDALAHEVVWVATAGGLGRIDAAVPSVIAITTADGLPSNNCFSVELGSQHAKLVGTDLGITIYRGW